jgi:putative SOS response-associated peptidase YedK
MCGRFVGSKKIGHIVERFDIAPLSRLTDDDWAPTWNAAPTHTMPVVTQTAAGRSLSLMRWSWPIGFKPGIHVNAIGETASAKGPFAAAFRARRCIVPATAFYEWQEVSPRLKLPWAFQVTGGMFAIAGLWQTVEIAGQAEPSFLLLTTQANPLVKPVHKRMAAILPRGAEGVWLDPATPLDRLKDLMVPFDPEAMTAHRVSSKVNRVLVDGVKIDGPELLAPIDAEEDADPGPRAPRSPPAGPATDQQSIQW